MNELLAMTNDKEYLIFNGNLYMKVSSTPTQKNEGETISVGRFNPDHDGCEECKFASLGMNDYPCKDCRNAHVDHWEAE